MMREDNFGEGFGGWQANMQAIAEALGGGKNVLKAVSKEFQTALRREQQQRLPKHSYEYPCWTEANQRDFDYSRRWLDSVMRHDPPGVIQAVAPYNGKILELREERVDLHGGEYYLCCGLISQLSNVYDSRARTNVEKWSPFITSSGLLVVHGSEYAHGEAKSVTVRSKASASTSLRKLAERHFKVQFENALAPA